MAIRWWLALAALTAASALGARASAAPGARAPGVGVAGPFGVVVAPNVRTPKGAAVVAVDPAATPAAKALARRIYQDPVLRPDLDEATVATLVGAGPTCPPPRGEAPAPDAGKEAGPNAESRSGGGRCAAELVELQDVIDAVRAACSGACNGSPVARRLLGSLGRDLAVQWVVLVSAERAVEGSSPTVSARLLRVSTGRFEPMVLGPSQPGGSGSTGWEEVVPILRSVARAAEPSTSRAPTRATQAGRRGGGADAEPGAADEALADLPKGAAADETDGGEVKVLSSPWFWGGLGVLVAAGITVFALSQSSLGEPDTVRLEGTVAP